MIRSSMERDVLIGRLKDLVIADKYPLIHYAGFSDTSDYVGQPRQTFSVVLSSDQLDAITDQIRPIYQQLVSDVRPHLSHVYGDLLPFDMIRIDCFFDTESNNLKALEINTRNVGMHEFVSWIDGQMVEQGIGMRDFVLDDVFIDAQMQIAHAIAGMDLSIAYVSNPQIPRWSYFDKLRRRVGGRIVDIAQTDIVTFGEKGMSVNGVNYNTLVKKYAGEYRDLLSTVNDQSGLAQLQPRWMRQFGKKAYLESLKAKSVLKTEVFDQNSSARYKECKDGLVLKADAKGSSKDIYLGQLYAQDTWNELIDRAGSGEGSWVVQEFCSAPQTSTVIHGGGVLTAPVQLGVFILPDPESSQGFKLDLVARVHLGKIGAVMFDPADINPKILFGSVIINDVT
jgi:hypothetical protein